MIQLWATIFAICFNIGNSFADDKHLVKSESCPLSSIAVRAAGNDVFENVTESSINPIKTNTGIRKFSTAIGAWLFSKYLVIFDADGPNKISLLGYVFRSPELTAENSHSHSHFSGTTNSTMPSVFLKEMPFSSYSTFNTDAMSICVRGDKSSVSIASSTFSHRHNFSVPAPWMPAPKTMRS